jgi:hypothetical protein
MTTVGTMTAIGDGLRKLAAALVLAALVLATLSVPGSAQGQTYGLTQGWYEGRQTFYYDFGANTQATEDGEQIITAPIYVLINGFDDEGNPMMVEGQHNIVGVVPGDPGYSDLWEVTFVTVPAGYEANTFTSVEDVLDSGYEMTVPGVLVNCPIVPERSTLSEGGAPLVQGWYEGEAIYYFDFGPNSRDTAPIYAFITGIDGEGNPQFVEGQANVIGVIPGDPGYSAFWYVNLVTVPADYEANSITSVEEVLSSGYDISQPGLLVNCPVLRTEEAAMPEMLPVTGGSGGLTWLLVAGVAAVVLGLLGLAVTRLSQGRAR